MMQPEELAAAATMLEELVQEVNAEDSPLAGGVELDIGRRALHSLRATKVQFGNPKNNLIRLTPTLFQKVGLELSPIHQRQMTTWHFYYMTVAVSMQPGPGTQFTQIECRLDLGPRGDREPIVQSLFPTSAWKEMLTLGAEVQLGLDGNLNWQAGLPDSQPVKELPGALQGRVAGQHKFKAYVTIPRYTFELGRSEIAATGEEHSECFWRIDRPDLKKAQTVQFGVVFKTPKDVTTLELSGLAVVEPHFGWLTADLADVFDALSKKFQTLLIKKDADRRGRERLPVGAHEMWRLELP